tara:strand:+ start:3184 stop:4836 length:1653 start_codon:yes stop_codon:yes gene_type:complete
MAKVVFVADFFYEQGVSGGAEVCNDHLINYLSKEDINVQKINSLDLTPERIKEYHDSFFIIANFMQLSEISKKHLEDTEYIIYEHDHKYVDTNNPARFVNMLAPQKHIINYDFYKNAKAVLCQSTFHSEIVQKNLLLDNIINLSGNIWSQKQFNMLKERVGRKKTKENIVLMSSNKNKGTPFALKYCEQQNIDFEKIGSCDYPQFLDVLSVSKNLIFFPQWVETFNRVSVEARILGCNLTTNSLVGVTHEKWFKANKDENLLEVIKERTTSVVNTFVELIKNKNYSEYFIPSLISQVPKISIITSLYKGEKYIKWFLEEITKQTIFDKCELLILDANSPEKEYEIIKPYIEKHNNIIYKRLEKRYTVQETMNIGIKMSSGKYLTLANIDDTRHYDAYEILAKNLLIDPAIHLVYADCLQTNQEKETFYDNSSNGLLYEHSKNSFSSENMIKCLPGPMPMWEKSIHENAGYFDETLKYAGDWEMWLRCVDKGLKFKKISNIMGLYLFNEEGLSTSTKNRDERFLEEQLIFNKYKHVFGKKIYNRFKGYFNE